MAEFAAFHYLMHKNTKGAASAPSMSMDDFAKQFGGASVSKGPPTFDELYSPRERRQLHGSEKLYWRSNERVEYRIYEYRKLRILIILCYNITTGEEYRPICVDAPLLYQLLENRNKSKPWNTTVEKRALSDTDLKVAIPDFLLSRLKLTDPIHTAEANGVALDVDRQCQLEKLSGDEYTTLGTPPPNNLLVLLEGIERIGKPIWITPDPPQPDPPSLKK